MDIIRNNPYRVLGVLSNASRKDIERNKSQIKAFAKVGKVPSFPYDFENVLGKIERTEDSLNDAVSKLSFDKDKVAYGLFWFTNSTLVDEETLNLVKERSCGSARTYLRTCGTQNFSTYINMGCLNLISENWGNAAYNFVRLFDSQDMWNNYVNSITDKPQSVSIDEELEIFVENLISNFPTVNWFDTFNKASFNVIDKDVQCSISLRNSKIYSCLLPKYQKKITLAIDKLLEEAASVNKSDAKANLNMAAKLEQSCKDLLASLKNILGNTNSTYIHYADEVALQILNNCIYYYNNDQANPTCAKNILRYVRFCVKVAEGQLAKDRCKNNFDVVKEAYDNMCPQEVVEEVAYLEKEMKYIYHTSSITEDNCFWNSIRTSAEKLNQIKAKIGENEKYYWRLSERLILFYLNSIIGFINNAMKAFDSVQPVNYYIELNKLHVLLKKCKPLLNELQSFPKKDCNCISFFNKNYQKFKELCIDYHVDSSYNTQAFYQPSYQQSTTSNTSHTSNNWRNQTAHNSYSSQKNNKKIGQETNLTKAEKWFIGVACVLLCIMVTNVCISISNAPSPKPKKPVQSINCNTEPRTYLRTDNDNNMSDSEENKALNEPYEVTYFRTGDMPYRNILGKGKYDKRTKNYLEIDNGGNTDAVVFLETLDGRKIRHAYIGKNEKYRMKHIPAGKYIVKIMQGNSWNEQKDTGHGSLGGFMENVSYSKSESYDPFVYPSYSSGKWGWYSITLYKTPDGNMSTQPINVEDFF